MPDKTPVYFYSHNPNSEGARNLSRALGTRRIKHENSRFKGSSGKTVINWGSTRLPAEVAKCNIINTPEAVSLCADKAAFFNTVKDHCSVPDFTTSIKEAKAWAEDDNTIIFCRTLTKASSGRGIVEAELPDEVVKAGLYTRYIPKKEEYRIHMFKGEPFLIQRKALSSRYPKELANWRIRNHDGGFIFARNEDHEPSPKVIEEAKKAFNAIKGLTFGSVDVIFNEHRDTAYVLEINTASGLDGSTLEDYTSVLKQVV